MDFLKILLVLDSHTIRIVELFILALLDFLTLQVALHSIPNY